MCWGLNNHCMYHLRLMTWAYIKIEKGLHYTNRKNNFLTVRIMSERPFQRDLGSPYHPGDVSNILSRWTLRKGKDPQFSCPNSVTFFCAKTWDSNDVLFLREFDDGTM